MSKLQHPNVVNFVEYFLQDDRSKEHYGACIIVMELLEGPDMMDYIDSIDGFSNDQAKVCSSLPC
jgi:serine/threonine protein kinase